MNVTFHDKWSNQVLACPRCGEAYLHHGDIRIFDRKEDAQTVTLIEVLHEVSSLGETPFPVEGSARVGRSITSGTGNPSSRRNGFTIAFTCECCGKSSTLGFAQHKGVTEVSWL